MNNLSFYKNEIYFLKNSSIYSTDKDEMYISNNRIEIAKCSTYLVESLDNLKTVLKNIIPETTQNDFLIKFPEQKDFSVLINDMSNIKKHIEMIIYDRSINSTLNLNNWEYGSFWLNITFSSVLAVQVLGSIVWSSAYISTQINKHKEQELYIEQLKLKNDTLKEMKEAHSKLLDKFIDIEINGIEAKHFEDGQDNQRSKKIKDTILLFSEIILRGGEFQPSLVAPTDIKKSYPNFKALDIIESQIKQIPIIKQ